MKDRIQAFFRQPRVKDWVQPTWTILFALLALLDFASCFSTWMDGWTEGRKQSHVHGFHHQHQREGEANGTESCPATAEEEDENEDFYSHPNCASSSYFFLFGRSSKRGNWKRFLIRFLMQRHHHHHVWGVLFCFCCIVESIRRALEARQTALDTAALDDFEKTLASLYSATRLFRHSSTASSAASSSTTSNIQDQDFAITRKFIRVWTPVVSTLVGWFLLLPWPLLIYSLLPNGVFSTLRQVIKDYHLWRGGASQHQSYHSCGDDPALATVWISQVTSWVYVSFLRYQDAFFTWLWKVALPVKLLWMQPIQFIQRLRLFSRWIRYFRYAGPLLRLLLKLQDQFRVFGKTWRQNWAAQSQKAQRLASKSMFFQDIQRLESLTKLQTRLASLPSTFTFGGLINNHINSNSNANNDLGKRQHEGPLLMAVTTASTASLSSLSVRPSRPDSPEAFLTMTTIVSADEDEEPLLQTTNSKADPTNKKATTTMTISTTPSPADGTPLAISSTTSSTNTTPTRDSVAVLIAKKKQESQRLKRRLDRLKQNLRQSSRITSDLYDRLMALTQEVTRTVHSAVWNQHLISPQTRFSVAWRLCVTFALLSELGRLLMSWQLSGTFELRYRDLTKRLLGLCQTKSRPFRTLLGKLVRLPHNHPWLDTCRQSSPSSQFSLTLAWWSEFAIDLIGFLDILVWFYTGELDEFGNVIPKPFFSRCILPGTLIQVLDHPTVPQTIPNLLSYFSKAARAVGYSRVIRWGLALYPALDLLLLSPLYRYLFHPMDKDEYLNYTESLVQLPYGFTSNPSMLMRSSMTSHNLIGTQQQGSTSNFFFHRNHSHPHPHSRPHHHGDDDESENGDVEHEEEEDIGHLSSFLRPSFETSYRDVLHASISENDGYGLYY